MAASGLATIPLQKSQGSSLRRPHKNRLPLAILGESLKITGSSQRPQPQVAAAARFRGRSDHGTLRLPKKAAFFGRFSSLPPNDPHLKNTNFIFVVSPSLTKTRSHPESLLKTCRACQATDGLEITARGWPRSNHLLHDLDRFKQRVRAFAW